MQSPPQTIDGNDGADTWFQKNIKSTSLVENTPKLSGTSAMYQHSQRRLIQINGSEIKKLASSSSCKTINEDFQHTLDIQ